MDRKLTAAQAAKRLGIRTPTWFAYVYRDQAPPPDGREELSGKPWWYVSTVDRYERERKGTPGRPQKVRDVRA